LNVFSNSPEDSVQNGFTVAESTHVTFLAWFARLKLSSGAIAITQQPLRAIQGSFTSFRTRAV